MYVFMLMNIYQKPEDPPRDTINNLLSAIPLQTVMLSNPKANSNPKAL
jgi:hypothetical protein